MEIPFIFHFLFAVCIRLALFYVVPMYAIPNRVEFNTSPYSLLDKPDDSLLSILFTFIPFDTIPLVTLLLSTLPALILSSLSKTSACVFLYNPFSIIASLAVSSQSLVQTLMAFLFVLPKNKVTQHIFSPLLPILIAIYPQAFPLLLPLLTSLSPTVLLGLPVVFLSYSNFGFPTHFFVTDLTPNIGLYWYLFTNMFQEYSLLYTVVLPLIPLFVSLIMYPHMKDHKFYYTYVVAILIAVCNPYISLQDVLIPMALFNITWSNLCVYFWKLKVVAFVFPVMVLLFSIFNDFYKYSYFNSNMIYAMNLGIGFTLFSTCEETVNGCLHNDFLVANKRTDHAIDTIY
ncbi:GPI transamidase component PIG-U, putative [Entamoeba invadens IP1]|uniref:GPI transamidase component PIG-U, putative n=1 Tax=Entamoeba invadens IP1 TaxID=370355 RepID=A0A0A1TY13_ENTIV|nr:GPI transamidase component PIG-U, putative [Entamoeba invadens IP1]ELP86402.1 GPI transamidase component PIG-U, putative [Entamoeba invadens IP1]|eukprot:XP_004185748.1 GPI transamidase component PIG-U, putative [Entamoeba invadens IP1]